MENITLNLVKNKKEKGLPEDKSAIANMNMSVSSVVGKNDEKKIYVLFTESDRQAEFVVPEGRLLSNKGFSEAEIAGFKNYIANETEYIYSIAKSVNPMKAFMGM